MNEQTGAPTGGQNSSNAGAPGATFFQWIRDQGVVRGQERWVAGVCGALSQRTGLDPLIFRGIAIVVALFGGPIFLLYAAGWLMLPDASGRIYLERVFRGIVDPAIYVIGALILATFLPFVQGIWWQGPPAWWGMPGWLEVTIRITWTAIIIAGLIWLVVLLVQRLQRQGYDREYWEKRAGEWGESAKVKAERASAEASAQATPQATPQGQAAAAAPEQAPASAPTSASNSAGQGSQGFVPPASPQDAPYDGQNPWHHGSAWSAQQANAQQVNAQREAAKARAAAEREHARIQRAAAAAQRAEWHKNQAREYKRRQPGAAFVSIVLGIALIAGVLTAVALDGFEWSNTSIVVGLAVALGVMGLATVVAGIRGKEQGGLGFFSFVAIVAILILGVFPRGTSFQVIGGPDWSATPVAEGQQAGYAVVVGSPTLDLASLDEFNAAAGGDLNLWLGVGSATVVLPDDAAVIIDTSLLAGNLEFDGDFPVQNLAGVFVGDSVKVQDGEVVDAFTSTAGPVTTVHLWQLVGKTTVELAA